MTWAILGAGGQLGRAFLARLGGKATPLTHAQADLTQPEKLRQVLRALRPRVVVNCAAYNRVDQAETDRAACFAVNAWGVLDLARLVHELGATFVHYSTNYVFGLDRQRRTPYTEADLPAPVNLYGVSKLAGEHFVRTVCPQHFVIRTAAVFGPGGPEGPSPANFVARMLSLARQGQALRIVDDQTISPTYTTDLAESSVRLVATGHFGLYHLSGAGECTWFRLAQRALELAGLKADIRAVTSVEYGATATRPAYSVLANAACRSLGVPTPRPWHDALQEYLKG